MDKKRLRSIAHQRLEQWAKTRAVVADMPLGSAHTALENRLSGLSASTAGGELDPMEAAAQRDGRTMQVERLVCDLPPQQRAAVAVRYLGDGNLSAWAVANNHPPGTARVWLDRALLAVGAVLATYALPRKQAAGANGKANNQLANATR